MPTRGLWRACQALKSPGRATACARRQERACRSDPSIAGQCERHAASPMPPACRQGPARLLICRLGACGPAETTIVLYTGGGSGCKHAQGAASRTVALHAAAHHGAPPKRLRSPPRPDHLHTDTLVDTFTHPDHADAHGRSGSAACGRAQAAPGPAAVQPAR